MWILKVWIHTQCLSMVRLSMVMRRVCLRIRSAACREGLSTQAVCTKHGCWKHLDLPRCRLWHNRWWDVHNYLHLASSHHASHLRRWQQCSLRAAHLFAVHVIIVTMALGWQGFHGPRQHRRRPRIRASSDTHKLVADGAELLRGCGQRQPLVTITAQCCTTVR